jgi:NodT family efflux transporter outer membrane factor (OMF) lipoprotein
MKRSAVLFALTCAACATGRANVTVPERKLPDSFGDGAGGASAANTRWRDWFADEDLNPLLAEALANNQDVLVALQRVEVSRAFARAATGLLLPQIAAGAGASVTKFGRYTMDGAGNAGTEITPGRPVPVHLPNYGAGLQASWEVDIWGRLRNLRDAARARYLASVEGTNLVLSSLLAEVAATYFDLLALDHTREVLRSSVVRQSEAVEVVRLQKQAGRANELAVQQFEAQLAETRATERAVAQQIVESENRLNALLGRYPRTFARRKEVLFVDPPAEVSTGLPSELLANRPDIREAELRVAAAKADVRAARAAFFPSFSITAALGFEAFNPAYLFRTPASLTYHAAGGLVAPLVNRRALEAQFAGARAEQVQAMYEYQRTVLGAYVDVVNALANLRTTKDVVALRTTQKAAAEQVAINADMLYRAAKATYLEVLLAQQSSLRADLDLVDAWKRRRLAYVAIYKALGGGWMAP